MLLLRRMKTKTLQATSQKKPTSFLGSNRLERIFSKSATCFTSSSTSNHFDSEAPKEPQRTVYEVGKLHKRATEVLRSRGCHRRPRLPGALPRPILFLLFSAGFPLCQVRETGENFYINLMASGPGEFGHPDAAGKCAESAGRRGVPEPSLSRLT